MATIPLYSTVIELPYANAADLADVNVTGYDGNGVSSMVNGVGNFYYDPASTATADNITVIQPDSGPGRWLIQIPTVSQTDVILSRASAGAGPVQELPITSHGRTLLDVDTVENTRVYLNIPATDGTDAVGTWPIDITGAPGSITGPATGVLGGNYPNPVFGPNVASLSKIQQLPANTLIGNNTGATANAQALSSSLLLLPGNNLSDVSDIPTSTTNLGIGDCGSKDVTDNSLSTVAMVNDFTLGDYATFNATGSLSSGAQDVGKWSTISSDTLFNLTSNQNYSLYDTQQYIFTADFSTSILTFSSNPGWTSGQSVTLLTTGTLPSPLVSGTTYYITTPSGNTARLSDTYANSLINVYITLTDNGTGTNKIQSSGSFLYRLVLPVKANVNERIKILGSSSKILPTDNFSLILTQNVSQSIILQDGTSSTPGITGLLDCTYWLFSFVLQCVLQDTIWEVTEVTLSYGAINTGIDGYLSVG